MKSKALIVIGSILVCIGVSLSSFGRAEAASKGGITVVFDGGAVLYFNNCDMDDFKKFGEEKQDSWGKVCGGGSETLSRINFSKVVALCPGRCN